MLEWLLLPVDPSRVHELSVAISWHARLMVIGWGFVAPLAVIIARFFKVMPGQDWPRELDNVTWWRTHWIGQTLVFVLTILALALVVTDGIAARSLHQICGYFVVAGVLVQVLLGIFRGSKGGPTAPGRDGTMRGDHYDMTPKRLMFEKLHKTIGYAVIILAAFTILLGLWQVNAPRWMWLVQISWWCLLIGCFYALQKRGMAMDTYQAIWGPDPSLPGNRGPGTGWGVRREDDELREET